MKRILALAAAGLIATNASAATKTAALGTITVPPTQSFSPGLSFSNGSNEGDYTFTLASVNTLTASSFTNTSITKGTKVFGAFDFSTIGLYSGTGSGGSLLETGTIIPRNGAGTTTAFLNAITLGVGSYTIAYTGKASGDPSTVGSSITFASGAVPEPAAWMLMVAGFGLVGFAARRRNAVTVAA